ncbi:MAG: hypothetical protein Ta2B_26140 [Termitinemataceae bacterium]|nr:MAG: hypothetical protein Ta2B_26140 [Termitinemataceae bacterium]
MKKTLFLPLLFAASLLLVSQNLSAQENGVRYDLGLNLHFGLLGVGFDTGSQSEDVSIAEIFDGFIIPLPTIGLYYQLGFSNWRFGIGISGYTLIVASIFYPAIYTEFDIGPLTLNAKIGGGYIIALGGFVMGSTAPILLPDLSLTFRIGDIFQLGAGITGMIELQSGLGIAIFLPYIGGRWVFQKH